MKRRIMILALALILVLTMTAVPAFAASKQVVQVSSKYYDYNEQSDKYFLSHEWKRNYEDKYLKSITQKYYNRNTADPTVVDSTNKTVISMTYTTKGLLKKRTMKYDDGSTMETAYTYKGKNATKIITKYKGKNSSKTVNTYNKKGLKTKDTYYYYQDGNWIKSNYYKYTYDSKGQETKRVYYSRNDKNKLVKMNTVTISYSSKKRTEKYFNNDNVLNDKYAYTLDSKGRNKKCVHTYYGTGEAGSNKYTDTTTFTYYNNGNVKEEVRVDSSGNKSTYTYRSDGQPKSFRSVSELSEQTSEYSYNKKGLRTKDVSTYTNYTLDENGEKQVNYSETTTWKYKYEGYYRSKYPKVIYTYYNGKETSMEKRSYKYIVDKTPEEAMMFGMGAG